ncbi:MAG: hypothetical protein FJW79_02700 [Actinobacteria bacterium]|nr:hypothetical protein [Actinomycetota bacterium]
MKVAALSADQAAAAISLERALEIAGREAGFGSSYPAPEAYLVRITHPGALMVDRPVWLVVWMDISEPGPRPYPAADPGPFTIGWVYIDALTGEYLSTTLTNQGH